MSLTVRARGADPLPLVLVPGLNSTAAVWDPLIARMGTGRELLAVDCPALDSVEALADAIAAVAPERFHLVGYSFGGYVALAMLERWRARIESLVMVASTAAADNEAARDYRRACIAQAEAGGHEALSVAGAAVTLHEDSLGNAELLERYLTIARAYGPERYIAHMRACIDRPDRTAVLAATGVPALFVGGEQDRIVSLKRQGESAAAAGAELKVIPGAGHQLPLEQPPALAEALAAWLAGRT